MSKDIAPIPQLRLRSEFSYRTGYGSPAEIAKHLATVGSGCFGGGLVDRSGTWGHVEWEQAMSKEGLVPMFGTEFQIHREAELSPVCWGLAENLPDFYRLSSLYPDDPEAFADRGGVCMFAGAALSNPDLYDYIDINPRSHRATMRSLELAKHTGKPVVITGDNDYPTPADRLQFLAWDDSLRFTVQHIPSLGELEEALRPYFRNKKDFMEVVGNTREAGERCAGLRLAQAPIISVDGDLRALVESGRRMRMERGHIKSWTPEYAQRLERELDMIEAKQYDSYFLVVADIIAWAKQRMLVGPARGSSAGSLVCYLLRITEVDPLVHGLIFERFIDVNRDDLPDIDIDFNDQKRHLVLEYLAESYGHENVARIGSISRLKSRSVIAHVGKKLAIPHGAAFGVTNVLIEYSSGDARYGNGLQDTLDNTQPGRDFMAQYPEAELMGDLENRASHSGQHAAGMIVANVPVVEHCTVRDGIAHIDKKAAEYLNLLKIDALGLRTLGVIEETGCITPEELCDLPLDDPAVLKIFDDAKFSGVFQFEGAAQRRVSVQVPMKSFKQIDHVTALARPGPLGGGAANDYINRNAGRQETTYRHESMREYLEDTYGVVLYQEQVMRLVREIGNFSWEDTSTIRKAMSGRKGQEFFSKHGEQFAKGAKRLGIDYELSMEIWDEICSFGAWGMNKSHTVSYAIISYWCAYMKCYHPLEYAAACLRNAKDDEQSVEILRELVKEGVQYEPFDPDLSGAHWTAADGKLLGGYENLVGIGPAKSAMYIARRDEGDGLSEKDYEKLASLPIKHHDLRPAHTKWGHYYDDPSLLNVHGSIKEFGELEDGENSVVICKLVRLERRDDNEQVRLARRGYAKPGQTLFLDTFMVDDSISKPVLARINAKAWYSLGERMADRAVSGEDWFLIRGRWLGQFSMMSIKKIMCLTNPEVFD
jgi:DNA-directed DNA polymerase III PolC